MTRTLASVPADERGQPFSEFLWSQRRRLWEEEEQRRRAMTREQREAAPIHRKRLVTPKPITNHGL